MEKEITQRKQEKKTYPDVIDGFSGVGRGAKCALLFNQRSIKHPKQCAEASPGIWDSESVVSKSYPSGDSLKTAA